MVLHIPRAARQGLATENDLVDEILTSLSMLGGVRLIRARERLTFSLDVTSWLSTRTFLDVVEFTVARPFVPFVEISIAGISEVLRGCTI